MQTIALSVTLSQTSNVRLYLNVALTDDSGSCSALTRLTKGPLDLSILLFDYNVNVFVLDFD